MKDDEKVVVPKAMLETAISFTTIFGNKVRILAADIREVSWHQTGYAEITTHFRQCIVQMSEKEFERFEEMLNFQTKPLKP